jgi:uncharacterized protein YbjT (DUF2867 family)
MKVLITGATGNVGIEVIKSLQHIDHSLDLYAGVRNLEADKIKFTNLNIKLSVFDFLDVTAYHTSLRELDVLFLLRPPQISAVEKYFKPLIQACQATGVKHIVFLSVQGVENSKIIPHHKIEKLIIDSGIPYTFLRPAYFMQNFTTTMRKDLVNNKQIFLPAGNAKFTLIDVRDIGAVAGAILANLAPHINKAYDLTCNEKMTFQEMAVMLSRKSGTEIQFTSPNLLRFFLTKRKEKIPTMFILVMIMLHYLPRFQAEPATTDWVDKIIHRQPTTFEQFIQDHKSLLTT